PNFRVKRKRSTQPSPSELSFKNWPPSPTPQQATEGGEDPPTRLIGNFLRKQRASGAKPSLDLDPEMEELGRPSHGARRVSFEDEHQKHISSDSDSDSDSNSDAEGSGRRADEMVRCKSTSTGKGPLLRAQTRSRLMDPPPPPPAAAPSVDKKHKSSASRSPKPGQCQSPAWRWSGPMDGEEEDPFVDEDIPDDFNLKSGELDVLTILQWVSLVLIIGALVCSATIRILSRKKVWELQLWKWELLALALVCGRLVSGWAIRIAMFCVGRNLLLRKRVLYFVYGVRSAVQNTLWLGLVLAAWHFLFDDKCQLAHMVVVSYVMKILFCLLVATLIRLVKTLLLKVLASSFHVSTYFDRIQASLFNQYVTETLSGPQLVEEQGPMFAEPSDLHAAMPTKNLSEQRSFRPSVSMSKQPGQGSKQLSKEKRQHQIDEGISIDKLHKLNRSNVSAWNMKRLMKIIRSGTLTTIDEQIKQATGGGDLSATHIRSEYESQMAAKKIFHNVIISCTRYIYLADLMHFMRQEEAIKAMHLFEGGQEYNRISKRSLKNWMVNAFRERKALALTLNDTKVAVSKLNQMTNVVGGVIVFVLWLLILGIATTNLLVFLSSPFLVAVIVFGDTLKAVFEAIVFLFVMHPFDVGDRCEIEEVQVVVEEMNILTTVFLRYDNLKIYYPNNVLATIPIMNFYRSPDMGEGIDFYIHVATPVAKLALMKERILRYINNKKEHWYPGAMIVLRDVDETNKLKVSIWLCHTLNFQDMGMRYVRRELVLQEMIKVLRDLDIEYRMLPLDVNVRNVPPIESTRMPTTWNYS
uniref:Mechanosensitive ion channel protein n=1 Tax=Aegilops tauschii subsp. strangulata TaxID=200361 RepID=A0A452XL21_AEGTS